MIYRALKNVTLLEKENNHQTVKSRRMVLSLFGKQHIGPPFPSEWKSVIVTSFLKMLYCKYSPCIGSVSVQVFVDEVAVSSEDLSSHSSCFSDGIKVGNGSTCHTQKKVLFEKCSQPTVILLAGIDGG